VHGQLHALQKMKRRGGHEVVVAAVSAHSRLAQALPVRRPDPEPGQDLTVAIGSSICSICLSVPLRSDHAYDPGISEASPSIKAAIRSCAYCIVPSTAAASGVGPPAVIVDEVRQLVGRGNKKWSAEPDRRAVRSRSATRCCCRGCLSSSRRCRAWSASALLTCTQAILAATSSTRLPICPRCARRQSPIQSGDDGVLQRMKRGYVVEHYRELIGRLRNRCRRLDCRPTSSSGSRARLPRVRQHVAHAEEFPLRRGALAMYSRAPAGRSTEMPRRRGRVKKTPPLHELKPAEGRGHADQRALPGPHGDVLVEAWQRPLYGRTRTNKLVHFASDLPVAGAVVDVHITATEPWFLEASWSPPS